MLCCFLSALTKVYFFYKKKPARLGQAESKINNQIISDYQLRSG